MYSAGPFVLEAFALSVLRAFVVNSCLKKMASNFNIAIIGVGRLGGALALALSEKGNKIGQLFSRGGSEKADRIAALISPRPEVLPADELGEISQEIIFITVPDPEIRGVAERLAGQLKHTPVVFHTSGALSSEVLSGLREAGCPVGSLHPLVSVSEARSGAQRFKDAFFCVEGDDEARGAAEKIVADLGGKSFSVATQFKALYHASAVMASGHLVALFSLAVEALAACGPDGGEGQFRRAQEILFPLVKSTVENLSIQAPSRALTGTFSRADAETLRLHLEALRENVSPEILAVYLSLGARSLQLAEQQGASPEKIAEMEKIMSSEC